jgi:pimeloyl-ACP methyl ester carboxylesterase
MVTVRSRCRPVLLRTPSTAAIAELLVGRDGLEPQLAHAAAAASQGHIGRALGLARDPVARDRRRAILALPLGVSSLGDCLAAAQTINDEATARASGVADTADEREINDLRASWGVEERGRRPAGFAGALSTLEKDQKRRRTRLARDSIDGVLIDLLSFCRDVIAVQCAPGAELVNADVADDVASVARVWTSESTLRRIDAIVECREALAAIATIRVDDKATGTDGPAPAADGVPSGLEEFYTQELSWDDCGKARCTEVEVPIDYEEPDGDTLKLQVKVIPATGDGGRSLFVNPGGPGGEAHGFADYMKSQFGNDVLDTYDIVGVDPRGVGTSTPIDCLSDRELDAYAASEPDPDNEREIEEYRATAVDFGNGCEERSGALASHISTEEAARDFDVVRALFGSKTFDWFGASYGTELGATYATLFPKTVGRMVLDGAVDPSLSAEESAFGQTTGFQRALDAYIEDCIQRANCPLGRNAAAAEDKLISFVKARDTGPLTTGEERKLTQGHTFYGIAVTLYDKSTWPVLTQALTAAFKGDGSVLLRLSDVYFRRDTDGTYAENLGEANPAINCLDAGDDDAEASTLEEVQDSLPRFEKASPVFGRTLAWGALGCTDWPIKALHPQAAVDATGSKPIVVLGTTRDPATPYEWAKALADQLGTAVLVSREGDGHTAYTSNNRCIKRLVDDYLVDGKVPKDGTTCKE